MQCPGDTSLALLIEGTLSGARSAELREHIASCGSCTELYANLQVGAGSAVGRTGTDRAGAAVYLSTPLAPPSPPISPGASPAVGSPGAPAAVAEAGAAAVQVGSLVGGRYRLERLIGEGGMGTVWAAEHVVTHERFALKLIRTQQAQRPGMRRRMLREAKAASAVRHPNAVRVIDVFEAEGGAPVLVMELLVGRSLRHRLADGPLPLAEVARVLVPAMAAVTSAHAAGVIHRDLKPDNLFLVDLPDGQQDVRVVDFGLARLIAVDGSGSQLTGSGEMLGTPSYMSPEQAFGEADLDARTDVWALGVILFECLAGHRPFDGGNFGQVMKRITSGQRRTLAEVAPDVPPEVADLIEQMLTVAKDQRPADLGEAMKILARHAASPITVRVDRPRRARWLPAVGVAGVVALTVVGLATRPTRRPVAPARASAAVPVAPAAVQPAAPPAAPAPAPPARPPTGSAVAGTADPAAASPPETTRPAAASASAARPARVRPGSPRTPPRPNGLAAEQPPARPVDKSSRVKRYDDL